MVSLRRESKVDDLVSRSLHPILTWMRWIGIDLIFLNKRKPIWMRFHAFLCFIFHLIAEIVILRFWLRPQMYLAEENEDFQFQSIASTFNYVIDFTSYAVHNLGSHVILLTIVKCRWDRLMTALRSCESFLHRGFYIRLYKLSVVGAAYTFIQVTGLTFLSVHYLSSKKSSFLRKLVSVMSVISVVYSTSFVVLFCLISYGCSAFFESIRRQVEEINSKNGRRRHPCVETLLLDFKRRHSLVIDVVVSLNECFGWNLLLTTSILFVNIINSSFYIFGEIGGINITDVSFGLASTIQLFALCLAADRISQQSSSIIRPILNMNIDRGQMESVTSFMSQVSEGVPEVTAMGCLNISKRLIPQAAGTTLTYFFILYQFHSSERHQSVK